MNRLTLVRAWLVAAFCLTAPAALAAAAASADIDGDGLLDRIVVRTSHRHSEVVVSPSAGGVPHVFTMPERPLSVAVSDVNHDGHVDFTALLSGRRLLVWLNYGKEGFSRLRSHMRWRFVRRTQPHALLVYSPFATKGIPDKSSDPAGQATPPTPVLLYDSSHRQALATAGDFRLPEEARMLPDRRAGPHPSRAPPADLVN